MEDEFAQMLPAALPAWLKRAWNPKTPMTKQNETMRTATHYSPSLKGMMVYPTIRMVDGRLTQMNDKDARDRAVRAKDYILLPGMQDYKQGARFSQALSREAARRRSLFDSR